MTESRKRLRSDDDAFSIQSKYFINQRIVDESDKKLMMEVYQKTLSKIFAGAKLQTQREDNVANNNMEKPILDTVDDKPSNNVEQNCMMCWRDVDASASSPCKNCNLRVCLSCHMNCNACKANLCSNCVMIFGCSMAENPMCEDCKMFVDYN